jgi:uncharacterized protein YjiS (DUF1127 family)
MKTVIDALRSGPRSNDRYLLTRLSERQLWDIGLDGDLVRRETAKPFWRP